MLQRGALLKVLWWIIKLIKTLFDLKDTNFLSSRVSTSCSIQIFSTNKSLSDQPQKSLMVNAQKSNKCREEKNFFSFSRKRYNKKSKEKLLIIQLLIILASERY